MDLSRRYLGPVIYINVKKEILGVCFILIKFPLPNLKAKCLAICFIIIFLSYSDFLTMAVKWSQKEIFLIGSINDKITGARLPSSIQVLQVFLQFDSELKLTVRESSTKTIDLILPFGIKPAFRLGQSSM